MWIIVRNRCLPNICCCISFARERISICETYLKNARRDGRTRSVSRGRHRRAAAVGRRYASSFLRQRFYSERTKPPTTDGIRKKKTVRNGFVAKTDVGKSAEAVFWRRSRAARFK